MDALTVILVWVQAFRVEDAMIFDVVAVGIPALDNDSAAAKLTGVVLDVVQLPKCLPSRKQRLLEVQAFLENAGLE